MAKKNIKTPQIRKFKLKEQKPQFTVKQQRFIDAYDGDIKKAAKKAKITYQYARRLATKSNILAAIKHRQDTEIRPKTIMTRQQRQQFWSEVANDENVEMKDRLRASELLGKSEADFVDVQMGIGLEMTDEQAAGIRERMLERFSSVGTKNDED